MNKFIKNLVTLVSLLLLVGCTTRNPVVYDQPSPSIEAVEQSGYKTGSRRDPNSVRYNKDTTLEAALKQASQVAISVNFEYKPSTKRGGARLRYCKVYIKSSDSTFYDPIRCHIEPLGTTFMVSFKSNNGPKAFVLDSLGGYWDGPQPVYYILGGVVSIKKVSTRYQDYHYVFYDNDPFIK